MIAFDTNILVYVLNNHPDFYQQSAAIVRQAQASGGCMSVLVAAELLSQPVLRNKSNREAVDHLLDALTSIHSIDVNDEVARIAAKIRCHNTLKLPDAIHLASALYGGATEFWTNDKTLAKSQVEGLNIHLLSSSGSAC